MRYLPLTEADRQAMLATIGAPSVDALFQDVPQAARRSGPIEGLPGFAGELEVERQLGAMAGKNLAIGSVPSFLGCGAYKHHVPATVDYMIQRGEFLTAYTPYQPEISQGTLQVLFEFQTQVALLTGMEVANASMYDGATACAEAVMMANRLTRRKKAILAGGLHPHYRDTTVTDARFIGFDVVAMPAAPGGDDDPGALVDAETSCVVVQNPDVFGRVRDYTDLARTCQAKGALLIVVVTEVVSLGLLTPPGEMGADIVVAEGQSLGNALNFGGPYVGLFAVKEKYVRQMPGRLCGQTEDADGRRGFVLTLSTREQHIRREKATSNICTNAGLCALAFSIHLSLLGEEGFTGLARVNHAKAVQLADRLSGVPGVKLVTESFFNEFTVTLPRDAAEVVEELAKRRILAGVPASRLFGGLPDHLILAATEMTTESDMEALTKALREVL